MCYDIEGATIPDPSKATAHPELARGAVGVQVTEVQTSKLNDRVD